MDKSENIIEAIRHMIDGGSCIVDDFEVRFSDAQFKAYSENGEEEFIIDNFDGLEIKQSDSLKKYSLSYESYFNNEFRSKGHVYVPKEDEKIFEADMVKYILNKVKAVTDNPDNVNQIKIIDMDKK